MAVHPDWNSNVPTGAQLLSQSQPLLNTNNQSINTVFNDSIGNFCKMIFCQQGSISSVTSPNSAIHTKNGTGITFNNVPIPYFLNASGDYPLMADVQSISGTQYYFALGNLKVYFGTVTTSGTSAVIAFSNNFTSINTYSIVGASNADLNNFWSINKNSNAQATVHGATNSPYNYLAIGY